jgi:DNA-binding response OmpR family regulator
VTLWEKVWFVDTGCGQPTINILMMNGMRGQYFVLHGSEVGEFDLLLLSGQCSRLGVYEDVRRHRLNAQAATLVVIGAFETSDVLSAFRAGADDCIARTLPVEELIARISARSRGPKPRRSNPNAGRASVDVVNASSSTDAAIWGLETETRGLRGPRCTTRLSRTEWLLARALASTPGPISAEQLAIAVLHRRDAAARGRDLVYRHLTNLRKKLELVGLPMALLQRTVLGYQLLLCPLAAATGQLAHQLDQDPRCASGAGSGNNSSPESGTFKVSGASTCNVCGAST